MLEASRATHSFAFGPFELDSDTGELRNSGTPVQLQPQPTRILKILLEHHGKLVTREHIQQQLWSEETFVEFEVGLNQAIKKLREALGDSAQTPVYIETIPRKGYRFIAEVRQTEDNGPTDPLLGRVLGHYRLVERIGQGGMGIIYRAHDEHLKRDVAIKTLPEGAVDDETARRRFRKEAMALAQLNHPNIANVSDFDSQEGIDFLVEELVLGTALDQMLTAGPLREKQIIELGMQLCQGLAAAHEHGVLHRDIKPANLRVTPDGRLKILDFGLAAVLHASKANVEHDATASVVEAQTTSGTLPYMAPEQLLNETLDARTDVWATGCVLYEMATGRLPFGGAGMELADAILHQTPLRPSEVNRKVSPALEAVTLKCLEKDPALRCGSAHEIGVDLNRISRTAPGPILRPSRRPTRFRAAVVVMVLLAASVSGYAIWKYGLPWISPKPPVAAGNTRKVVAVLYFKNMSQDPSLNWLNGGLTEMMTTNLDQVGGMEVLSTDRIASIRKRLKIKPDQELPPEAAPELAREAGADAYVTGTLVRLGPSRLRVDVHLQEVSTGKIVFSDKVESPDMNGIFAMVDTMTSRLAERLVEQSQRLEDVPNIKDVGTSNVEALRHYEAGAAYHRRLLLAEAAREYEQAIRLDPNFGVPYVRLFFCYSTSGEADKVRSVLRSLEQLKPRLARGEQLEYESARAAFYHDFIAAIRARKMLLVERPRDSGNRVRLANLLLRSGSLAESLRMYREGLALDPKDPYIWNFLAYAEAIAGHESAALDACKHYKALLGEAELNPWDTSGDVLYLFQRYDEAEANYRKVQVVDPDWGILKVILVHSRQGKGTLALKELDELKQRVTALGGRFDIMMVEAQLAQSMGETEAALRLYREFISQLVREKNMGVANSALRIYAIAAIITQQEAAALSFARQQTIPRQELTISLLEAAMGNEDAAENALHQFKASDLEAEPSLIIEERAFDGLLLALKHHGDLGIRQALSGVAPRISTPEAAFRWFLRGRGSLAVKDYVTAEHEFQSAIREERNITNDAMIQNRMPVLEHLSHFHLGQIYEATQRRDEAIREYQTFLSHYPDSHSRLPEITQARATLKRLQAATPRT